MAVTVSSKELMATLEQQVVNSQSHLMKFKQLKAKKTDILDKKDRMHQSVLKIIKRVECAKTKFCKELQGILDDFFDEQDNISKEKPILDEEIKKFLVDNVEKSVNVKTMVDKIQGDVKAVHERTTKEALDGNKREKNDLMRNIKTEDQLAKENEALKKENEDLIRQCKASMTDNQQLKVEQDLKKDKEHAIKVDDELQKLQKQLKFESMFFKEGESP